MMNFLASNTSIKTLLVEKTYRLYRNSKDWVTIDELDLEVHFVKENEVLSDSSRSSEKFMHGIRVLMAKNYIDNLSEEVKKGQTEIYVRWQCRRWIKSNGFQIGVKRVLVA